jgi:hypothetical protein
MDIETIHKAEKQKMEEELLFSVVMLRTLGFFEEKNINLAYSMVQRDHVLFGSLLSKYILDLSKVV